MPSWVPVCLFQKPHSGRSTACMKEPRASHFWSQELKDHVINSGWLSVCWSSLPEGLNILPDRLWWLLYMLFIMLQFGTHKAATWSSLWTLAEQSFLNTTAAGLFTGAEQCWDPISIHIIPCFYLGIVTADWSCRVQENNISVFCMPCSFGCGLRWSLSSTL